MIEKKTHLIHSSWIRECVSKSRFVPFENFILSNMRTQVIVEESQPTRNIVRVEPVIRMKKKKEVSDFMVDDFLTTAIPETQYTHTVRQRNCHPLFA